ncbi:MAG: prolyl oligopeptidase family serine peptidase, partial [Deltaproteobacteria bacterium]|nr:prolyl oligopeptidase family serine peptidase [Deltaproteobacteria bacterium]
MRLDLSVSSLLRLARSRVAGMVLVACALGACGDDDGGGTTVPPPPPTPPMDAGPSDDTGPGNRDTGPGDRDTGPADRDTGPTDRDAGSVTNVPGRHDVDIVVEDQMRHLIVYVPESVAGAVAAPVVFMVHGTSGDGERFFNSTSWNEVADAEGIIVVYPDALTYCFHQDENGDGDFDDPDEQHVTTKWNSGFFSSNPLCTAEEIAALPAGQRARADHPLRDDVAFFLAMIDRLSVEAVIDTRRVYATGFSNGAQMTSRLGNDAPDRFAAVASHAGYL